MKENSPTMKTRLLLKKSAVCCALNFLRPSFIRQNDGLSSASGWEKNVHTITKLAQLQVFFCCCVFQASLKDEMIRIDD